MLMHKEWKDQNDFFLKLKKDKKVTLELGGSELTVFELDYCSKFLISTPVYMGLNYIPKSVRHCLSKTSPFQRSPIKTNFHVDEDNYKIYLNYLGSFEVQSKNNIYCLLEEFSALADKWKCYLDEHDKQDLVYVRAH